MSTHAPGAQVFHSEKVAPTSHATKTPSFERVHFRMIQMPCCGFMACWVNPRWPTYCPECGTQVYPQVKTYAVYEDDDAVLEIHR